MCKLQAFCVLVLTLLAFSQESPVPSKKNCLLAALKDLESLKTMKEVMTVETQFVVPTNVQENCTVQALHCFSYILVGLQRRITPVSDVTNTISNVMRNLEEIMGMDIKQSRKQSQCYKTECKFAMSQKNTTQTLEDFLNFLQQMYRAQQ